MKIFSWKHLFAVSIPLDSSGDTHLKILQMLSRKLMDEDFRDNLLKAVDKDETLSLLEEIN